MRWGILLLILFVSMSFSIASAKEMTIDGGDVWIKTNYSSTCLWYAEKPMRECYHDFYIIPKDSKSLTAKIISPKLKFDTKQNTQLMSMSLNYESKLKTSLTNEPEFYRIEFIAPPNYHEKYNFTINIDGKDIEIDPDVSVCSDLIGSGTYLVTADIPAFTDECFKFNGNAAQSDIILDGQNHYMTGAGAYAPFDIVSDHNITIKNFRINTSDNLAHTGGAYSDIVFFNITYEGNNKLFSDDEQDIIIRNSSISTATYYAHGHCGSDNFYTYDSNISVTSFLVDSYATTGCSFFFGLYRSNIVQPSGTCLIDLYFDGTNLIDMENNTFSDLNGDLFCGNLNAFVHTIVNEFSGNFVNHTADNLILLSGVKYADQILLNDTVKGNYWFAPDGSGFSDTCNCVDGFCDSEYEIDSHSTINYTDYLPLCAEGDDAYTEDIVLTITSPPEYVSQLSTVIPINFYTNASCNLTTIQVNGSIVYNSSDNATIWSYKYIPDMNLKEAHDFNISVSVCSYLNNTKCEIDDIYTTIKYSYDGTVLLLILVFVVVIIFFVVMHILSNLNKNVSKQDLVSFIGILFLLLIFVIFILMFLPSLI